MSKTLILCDCLGSQIIDAEGVSKHSGLPCSKVHSSLCTTQLETATKAIATGEAILCCTQEQHLFEEIAAEINAPAPPVLDLRDRAGWSTDTGTKLPKMTALIAEASLPTGPSKSIDVVSEGLCLILGTEDIAFDVAEQLKDYLSVTVLVENLEIPPLHRDFEVIQGHLKHARGALGQFKVTIDGLQQIVPGGHGSFSLSAPRDGGQSECDIIIDLRGDTALFPAPDKREGYLWADPNSLPAVSRTVLQASHLVGTFEKPLYVKLDPMLCAHSRAEQIGCSNCLDICPTGAITPAGDHVSIDPMICAGCGACSALCPSGAVSYDAPASDTIFKRVQTLATAYLNAGGDLPRLLVVDAYGSEMIQLTARFGNGLPANVIPLEVTALNTFGHAEALAALAAGFVDVSILQNPTTDRTAMAREVALACSIGGSRVHEIDTNDPEKLSDILYNGTPTALNITPIRPMGSRRQITRQAAKTLTTADILSLPEDAPYGAVLVDTSACTLCLSCVSLCPSGALCDNPDLPQLRFQEDACLQCGLCSSVCPENAISYETRLNLTDTALEQTILNEEEPFPCVECGALFGVKSTIEKISEKLSGKHAMFQKPEAARMIQMCDNCRINAQYHSKDNPFTSADRPRVRTSDDYFSKRRDH